MTTQPSNRLAKDGGQPAVHAPLPPMYPGGMAIDAEEEAAVLEVLRTKRLFRYYGPQPGPSKVSELEQVFARTMETPYALAVTSGTAALMTALTGLGIGPGDEVIVPAYTWIASASAVTAVGAVPVIAEVDDSLTLDPQDVAQKITPYTRAILPVHMRGAPCQMDKLMAVARQHSLKVLEDSAQANGASFGGRRLGSIGDAGAFSLQFNKILTSGEGGMAITSDLDVFERMLMFHDVIGGRRNNIPEERVLPGINFRMPELLGAVGLVQLARLEKLLTAMRYAKHTLKANLEPLARQKGVTFRTIHDPDEAAISLIFFLPEAELAQRTVEALEAEGVGSFVLYSPEAVDYHIYAHWSPIMAQRTWHPQGGPWQRHARKVTYQRDECPRSLALLGRAVHIDVSPQLSNTNLEEISEALDKVLRAL